MMIIRMVTIITRMMTVVVVVVVTVDFLHTTELIPELMRMRVAIMHDDNEDFRSPVDDRAGSWHDEDDRRGQYGNSLSGLLITQLLNQLIALVTKIKIIITTKINIINNRMCVHNHHNDYKFY